MAVKLIQHESRMPKDHQTVEWLKDHYGVNRKKHSDTVGCCNCRDESSVRLRSLVLDMNLCGRESVGCASRGSASSPQWRWCPLIFHFFFLFLFFWQHITLADLTELQMELYRKQVHSDSLWFYWSLWSTECQYCNLWAAEWSFNLEPMQLDEACTGRLRSQQGHSIRNQSVSPSDPLTMYNEIWGPLVFSVM